MLSVQRCCLLQYCVQNVSFYWWVDQKEKKKDNMAQIFTYISWFIHLIHKMLTLTILRLCIQDNQVSRICSNLHLFFLCWERMGEDDDHFYFVHYTQSSHDSAILYAVQILLKCNSQLEGNIPYNITVSWHRLLEMSLLTQPCPAQKITLVRSVLIEKPSSFSLTALKQRYACFCLRAVFQRIISCQDKDHIWATSL